MHIFDYETIPEQLLTPEVVRLLSLVHEHRGRQMLLLERFGNRLIPLRTEAERQSGRAANIGTTAYESCLKAVREHFDIMVPEPALIRDLHKMLFPEEGGSYRTDDTVISEIGDGGVERERFRPVAAADIEEAVYLLCNALKEAAAEERHDPLLLIAMFVTDFLSIHPFRDGNGKLAWLLQTLMLYRSGYYVNAYVSLERLTEEREQAYKKALQYSSIFWQDGTNSYEPFACWFLELLYDAYRQFEQNTGYLTGEKISKSERIRETILSMDKPVTKRMILEQYPDIAVVTVERTLTAMVKEGLIRKQGGGPSTFYVTINSEGESPGSADGGD